MKSLLDFVAEEECCIKIKIRIFVGLFRNNQTIIIDSLFRNNQTIMFVKFQNQIIES